MSLTRRQRTLEKKLNAVKARKRVQSAEAATGSQIGEKSDDVLEVQVRDSKVDKQDDSIAPHLLAADKPGETLPDGISDSPVSSRADDDEEPARKGAPDSPASSCSDDYQEAPDGLLMPIRDNGVPPGVVDTREDTAQRSDSTHINKASPLRRFDIVEGNFAQQGVSRAAHKKPSKAKLSDRHRRSRKVRRDHAREDDTLSFDSQLETWMNEGKGNPLASALDRVFDYFDEMRSVGDESYSIRTEKTEEFIPVPPRQSPGSFFADVEGLFTEGFSCGSLAATCESLTAPTYSFHEDESTLSGTKGSKEALDSSASMERFPKKFERDIRSEPSSVLPEEEDAYTSAIATKEEPKQPNETQEPGNGQSLRGRKSLDSQYGAICHDMCFVPVDCLSETPEINRIGNASSPNKPQQLVQEATDQEANTRHNSNSDVIPDIEHHPLDAGNSTVLPAPEEGSQNILMAGESVQAAEEKDWNLNFLSSASLLSNVTQTVSAETQSVGKVQEIRPSSVLSNKRVDSKLEGDGEEEETNDRNYLYAIGQSIKPSASFFSLDTRMSHAGTKADETKTAFQEAVAKLREINSTPVPDRIRELGNHVKEVLTCTANVIPQDSSVPDLSTNGQTVTISMENLQNMCSCTECHAPVTEIAVQENIVHHDVELGANDTHLGNSTTKFVASSMNMAKSWENTDLTRTGTDRPECKLHPDWHNHVPGERYSADVIAEIVSDDENAEPEGIPSSTISSMGGLSSAQTVSTFGFFDEISLEAQVKPRRKWQPISKVPKGNVVGHPKDVKEWGNGIVNKPTKSSSATSGHNFNDENAPNKKWMCEQSGTQKVGLTNTCHPFVSTKAKREAWRNTQSDDFADIMSANARADDWHQIVVQR